jgi:cell pole-organizing protein PopZ
LNERELGKGWHGEMVSMTDHDNSQGEPTMEEILASIRRIISEDNDDSHTTKPEARAAEPAPEPKGQPVRRQDSDVLELSPSQMVRDERPEPSASGRPNGIDRAAAAPERTEAKREAPAAARAPVVAPSADDSEIEETLLSPEVATAAAAAFGALSKDVVVSRSADSRSLEELVKEMMKPMLKEWLDENLPPLVEEVIEREVRRLSHRRVRR